MFYMLLIRPVLVEVILSFSCIVFLSVCVFLGYPQAVWISEELDIQALLHWETTGREGPHSRIPVSMDSARNNHTQNHLYSSTEPALDRCSLPEFCSLSPGNLELEGMEE